MWIITIKQWPHWKNAKRMHSSKNSSTQQKVYLELITISLLISSCPFNVFQGTEWDSFLVLLYHNFKLCCFLQSKIDCCPFSFTHAHILPFHGNGILCECRYQLLLDQLLKATPPEHPDRADLASALQQIVGVADYMNERKRDVENLLKITNLQSNLIYKNGTPFVVRSFDTKKNRNTNSENRKWKRTMKKFSEQMFYLLNVL